MTTPQRPTPIDPVIVPRELLEDIRHYLVIVQFANDVEGDFIDALDKYLPSGGYIKPLTPTY